MQKATKKLNELHSGEEFLRSKSMEFINSNQDMLKHAEIIEKAMDVFHTFTTIIPADENKDEEALRLLGMRLFNGCAATFQLTTSGYYQAAGMLIRDLLETAFLIGYFDLDQENIKSWRTADDDTRKKEFSAFKIRCALDERDGFKGKKRAEEYKLLCELAAHPTYKGLRMLAPKGMPHHCGPFFDPHSCRAVLEHLAKLSISAGQNFGLFFDTKTKETMTTKIEFLELSGEWMERFWGRPFDRKEIDECKELINQL